MSQFPLGTAPLRSVIPGARQLLMAQMEDQINPDQFDPFNPAQRLQHAHEILRRQAASRSAGGLPRAAAPMAQEVQQAKARHQAQPPVAAPVQHDFGNSGTPQEGSIEITRGHGPNAISPLAMQQFAQRAIEGARPGEKVEASGSGFRVSGGAVNGPQAAPDPVVQAFAGFRGHVPDEVLAQHQQAINGGVMTPQQAFHSLQTIAHQIQAQQAISQRQAQAAHQKEGQAALKTATAARQKFEKESEAEGFDVNRTPADYVHPGPYGSQTIRPKDAARLQQFARLQQTEHQAAEALHPALHPPQPGHPLDRQTAAAILQQAGGDMDKARQLAQSAGWSF